MSSRKQLCFAALSLIVAACLIVGLRTETGRPQWMGLSTPGAVVQPATYVTGRSLRDAAISNAMLFEGDIAEGRAGSKMQAANRIILPPVIEFTLTPPGSAQESSKTTLSARFAPLDAERLSSQIPMTLGTQNVVLRRSSDDPSTFVSSIDFDWQVFTREQQQRKQAANNGRMVPVFEGRRYVRSERMQFIDPADIQAALQSHQPIQFSPKIISGDTQINVFPDHDLVIVNTAVVEDVGSGSNPARTFDQCLQAPQGNQTGAWTFARLMMSIAGVSDPSNLQIPENMLLGLLNNWNQDQHVNSFTVLSRGAMGQLSIPGVQTGTGLLQNWPVDGSLSAQACTGLNGVATACPSLLNAPVRLEAIVNRTDLGEDPQFPVSGELRFVFTVTTGISNDPTHCAQGAPFNIILEYNVPSTNPAGWAAQWTNLSTDPLFGETYRTELEAITDQVVQINQCTDGSGNAVSCLAQIRTNDLLLSPPSGVNAGLWELREFHLAQSNGQPVLQEATVAMTPDSSFNILGKPNCSGVNNDHCSSTDEVTAYIVQMATNTEFQNSGGAAPQVPFGYPGPLQFFRGGSALNGSPIVANAFWNDSGIPQPSEENTRIDFSANTCNGCHGAETATGFQQIIQRPTKHASGLSGFLLGCTNTSGTCSVALGGECSLNTENLGQDNTCFETVTDPVTLVPNATFGDIARRVLYLGNVQQAPTGSGLLVPFLRQHIGVH
jgi:hypothetical protein